MGFLAGLLEKTGLTPYLWLIKLAGVVVMCIALLYAWHRFTGHYIQIGVDKQYKADKAENDKQRQEAFDMYVSLTKRYAERNAYIVTIENKLGVEHEKYAQLDDRNHVALSALQLHWSTNKDARCGQGGGRSSTGNSSTASDQGASECESSTEMDGILNGIVQEVSNLLYEGDQYINEYRLQRDERKSVICY